MAEQDVLSVLADSYRLQGYEVNLRPMPEDLPDFARRSEVQILAKRGRETVLLSVNEAGQPDDVLKATDVGLEYVGSLVLEAEQMLGKDTPRSALLIAWAAVEAAAREQLRQMKVDADRMTPLVMVNELASSGCISLIDRQMLRHISNLRNSVAHGLRPDSIPPETITFLIDMARRLVRTAHDEAGVRGSSYVAAAEVFRAKLNKSPRLKEKAERASAWLQDILGNSRSIVSAEWDLAEDARECSVVTLTLSDFTGTVTTTFDPSELENERQMRFRLNRLWADLLRIRSHKEIEVVIRTSGSITSNG